MVHSLRVGSVAASVLVCAAASVALASPLPLGGQTATIAPQQVDVELVLAVDVSFSMDDDEQRIQRQGYVDALRSREFIGAVEQGAIGSVAITYVEWGGIGLTQTTVPWTIIRTAADATAFADSLEAKPLVQLPRTSISGAIRSSIDLIKSNSYQGIREVIDVSGDGPNNAGAPVLHARDFAHQQGVIINGLPLLMKRDGDNDEFANLDAYYRDCVITGPGSFVIPVRGKAEFANAIRTKIIREIATAPMPDPLVMPASDMDQPKANCLAGEKVLRSAVPKTIP
jgi:hypothetical protein